VNAVTIFLQILQSLIAIGLIVVVILQPGRSAGLGIVGGGAESLLGRKRKGIDAFLSKITVYLAVGFMIASISLAVVAR
jgi:preprotein translocase subunit SecG